MGQSDSSATALKGIASAIRDVTLRARAWLNAGGSKRKAATGAGAVAALGAVVMVAAMTTGALGLDGILTNDNHNFPDGTTAINDPLTTNNYASQFGNSTADAGKTWTDKTVIVPTESGNANAEGETATFTLQNGQQLEVDKSSEGVFLTSLSALTSSLQVSSTPTPLDIVLVLDVSGSMNYSFGGTQDYYPVYDNYLERQQIATWNGSRNNNDNNSSSIYYQSGTNANGTPIYSRVYRVSYQYYYGQTYY